ncbi:hypothetical protein BJ508DRAFT_335671 [Ascobolus immersus RN42]|uniref:Uncharacterized protein n=1 Tax=Ascobolus immersus RN42 TaxID=1160509 RepID=A0A3N4HBK1_ASCIM|nr:hypothetical protein BJ508DRAFT_335671 [Ascobolus immersus RN42]
MDVDGEVDREHQARENSTFSESNGSGIGLVDGEDASMGSMQEDEAEAMDLDEEEDGEVEEVFSSESEYDSDETSDGSGYGSDGTEITTMSEGPAPYTMGLSKGTPISNTTVSGHRLLAVRRVPSLTNLAPETEDSFVAVPRMDRSLPPRSVWILRDPKYNYIYAMMVEWAYTIMFDDPYVAERWKSCPIPEAPIFGNVRSKQQKFRVLCRCGAFVSWHYWQKYHRPQSKLRCRGDSNIQEPKAVQTGIWTKCHSCRMYLPTIQQEGFDFKRSVHMKACESDGGALLPILLSLDSNVRFLILGSSSDNRWTYRDERHS